jgi:hypothetical protein
LRAARSFLPLCLRLHYTPQLVHPISAESSLNPAGIMASMRHQSWTGLGRLPGIALVFLAGSGVTTGTSALASTAGVAVPSSPQE